MTEYLSFVRNGSTGIVLKSWFEDLGKGEKAALKRCSSLEEIALTAPFHALRIRLSGYPVDPSRLALVVALSAYVKKDRDSERIAVQMAKDRAGKGREPLSDLRFRKLLAIEDRNDLYHTMIRIIRMLSGEVNLLSLADAMYWWNISVKKQFASDYYEHAESRKKE